MNGAVVSPASIALLVNLLPAAVAPTTAAEPVASLAMEQTQADATPGDPLLDPDTGAAESSRWDELWRWLDGSGSWRVDYFSSSKHLDDDTHFLDGNLQLKAVPQLSERFSGKFEFRLTQSSLQDTGTRGRLVEGYITAGFEHADLHLGKQIVAWGRADGINPTDNLTPRDYTVQLPFEDDQRYGTSAVTLNVYVTPTHTLTLFTTPFFEPTIVPLPSSGYRIVERAPAASLSNTEVGVRLDNVGESLDWSVSYYRGFSLTASARLPPFDSNLRQMELTYDRITVFGADVTRNYGRFGVRAEVAYVDTSDDAGRDPVIKNPQLYWIAGIDRTFYENLNFNLQYFQRRIRHYRDPATFADPQQRSTALVNATFNGQRDAINDGLSFRVTDQWLHNTLKGEVFGLVNLSRGDRFVRAAITYAMNDDWTITLGGEHYHGDADTQYGSLSENNSGFVEVRYGF